MLKIKLTQTSKMPCKSWGLQAQETCPGSFDASDNLVPVCQGCYAVGGYYEMPSVVALRAFNKEDWKRDNWVLDMIQALKEEDYFRWFDSGDIYSLELARKIWLVCFHTSDTKHWIPTRSHKVRRLAIALSRLSRLPNVCVRRSSDDVCGRYGPEHGSAVVPLGLLSNDDERICKAYTRDFNCGNCRRCWDKNVPVVLYPAHGQEMKKVVKFAMTRDLF